MSRKSGLYASISPKEGQQMAAISAPALSATSPGAREHRKHTSPQHAVSPHASDGILELQQRELEEARVRATQMEKTMRWWSDCTSNWRDKWTKVRNERNKAREENRHLRSKLDTLAKECINQKQARRSLMSQNEKLLDQLRTVGLVSASGESDLKNLQPRPVSGDYEGVTAHLKLSGHQRLSNDAPHSPAYEDNSYYILEHVDPSKHGNEKDGAPGDSRGENQRTDSISDDTSADERFTQLQVRLEELQKALLLEKDEKEKANERLDRVTFELTELRITHEEICKCKEQADMQVSQLRESYRDQMCMTNSEIEDSATGMSSTERRITELRKELERLQAENASEWARREQLESDKKVLERENKQLHSTISDMKEQLERKQQHTSALVDSDMKTLNFDLTEKTKEAVELRHTQSRLKKSLQDRTTELDHTRRRTEQYELEVKKLRGRIEGLKNDLTTAEDEVDTQTINARRVQRTNEELQAQVDTLLVQVEHLQCRLRVASQPVLTTRSTSMRSFDGTLVVQDPDEADEGSTDEDDVAD